MHRALATARKVALGSLLVLLAFAAVAMVGARLREEFGAGSPPTAATAPSGETARLDEAAVEEEASSGESDLQQGAPPSAAAPAATPAEVLAARFPAADTATQPPTFSVASVIPGVPGDTFDPAALSGMAAVEPPWPNAERATEGPEPGQPDESSADPAKGPANGTAGRRSSARSPNVLNDAMIASIKRRLRLTAEQEKLWLPVETALRKLTYTKAAMNPQRGQAGAMAYIDPASAELRELKAAALPLILRLNDGQKREVRDIVHVMGLEAVASEF
jgi:hypothetical protein